VSQPTPKPERAAPRRPRKWFSTGRVLVGGTLIVAVSLAVVALLSTVSVPTVQAKVEMPGMAPHLLSLWFDSTQDPRGAMEITGQLLDAGGTPVPASSMRFSVIGADASLLSSEVGIPLPITNLADRWRFRAVAQIPAAGNWDLDVEVLMSGQSATVRIPIEG
jgi:hypothetical protein